LGKALNRTAEKADLGYGSVKQKGPSDTLHFRQVQPQNGGHHLIQGAHGHFRHSESKVSGGAQLIEEPRVSPALVHVREHLGVVDQQNGHGMQRGGCLSSAL